MIEREGDRLSVTRQCQLVGLSRSTLYYRPVGESAATLALMRRIDKVYLKYPFYGSRQMIVRHLAREGVRVGRHRVRRLSATVGVIVGALHRDWPIQPVHRLGAIPLEPKHHLATLHPPPLVARACLLRQVLHYLPSYLHQALVHAQFQPQHPSGTVNCTRADAVVQLHLDKLNDVSDQFLIHVDLPVVAIVLLTGRSFLPLPKTGSHPIA